MRLGHDDGAFFFSRPDAAQQECCEPGFTLLCMGLFSRFFVQALPCTAEGTVCRVRDTRSLVPRAYGTNRSSSNTSCSSAGQSPSGEAAVGRPIVACGSSCSQLADALRPRIKSEALSAIIMVEALRLAEIIRGMIDASMTRRPCNPCTRSWSSTTAQVLSAGPMRQVQPG